jgi:hypothetical protein
MIIPGVDVGMLLWLARPQLEKPKPKGYAKMNRHSNTRRNVPYATAGGVGFGGWHRRRKLNIHELRILIEFLTKAALYGNEVRFTFDQLYTDLGVGKQYSRKAIDKLEAKGLILNVKYCASGHLGRGCYSTCIIPKELPFAPGMEVKLTRLVHSSRTTDGDQNSSAGQDVVHVETGGSTSGSAHGSNSQRSESESPAASSLIGVYDCNQLPSDQTPINGYECDPFPTCDIDCQSNVPPEIIDAIVGEDARDGCSARFEIDASADAASAECCFDHSEPGEGATPEPSHNEISPATDDDWTPHLLEAELQVGKVDMVPDPLSRYTPEILERARAEWAAHLAENDDVVGFENPWSPAEENLFLFLID